MEELLSQRIFVADGAMGTMLYSRGVFINRCFDELNLTAPGMIAEIHRKYAAVGAEILGTNTFGANRPRLFGFGLADKIVAINQAGVRPAREAASEIPASMPPLATGGFQTIEQLISSDRDLALDRTMIPLGSCTMRLNTAAERLPIPSSTHGTNPTSAQMAGMEVVIVECDTEGNVDLEDLEAKASRHGNRLAAAMVTYPSTHGVFEKDIRELCVIAHRHGGHHLDARHLKDSCGVTVETPD